MDVLALPPDGFAPVPLVALEAKCGRKLVEGLINVVLFDEAVEKWNSSGVRNIYTGLVLRCPLRYLKRVRRLQLLVLVKFASSCRCRVGMVAVKKNDEQRFVLEAPLSS